MTRFQSLSRSVRKLLAPKPTITNAVSTATIGRPEPWVTTALSSYKALEKALLSLDTIRPRFDPLELLLYAERSGYHSSAINLKVATTVGAGYDGSPELLASIDRANANQSFQDLLDEWATDLEIFGNAYVEVRRSGADVSFYRAPAVLMRRLDPMKEKSGAEFLQYVYQPAGTGTLGMAYTKHARFDARQDGVRHFMLPSASGSPFYGDPLYSSVVKMLKLNASIIEYADKFFDQSLMPDMAMILKGAQMSTEQQEAIKGYLQNFKGVGNSHKLLFLQVDVDEQIDFHEFNKELLSDSLSKFRQDNRDEIISAHRVPPRLVSVLSAGALGGTGEVEGQLKVYKMTFCDSRQKKIEAFWRQIFTECGFPQADTFALKPLDASAGTTDMSILTQALAAGIISQAEARQEWMTEKSVPSSLKDSLAELKKQLEARYGKS